MLKESNLVFAFKSLCQKKSLSTAVIPIILLFAMFSKARAKRCGRSFLRKLLAEKELTTPEVRRVRFGEFLLSSEGKNDLVSLQEL